MTEVKEQGDTSVAPENSNQSVASETASGSQNQSEKSSFVEELVGPNKKFKSVDALAKGKQEADAFIEQLKAEKALLSRELELLKLSANQPKEENKMFEQQNEQSNSNLDVNELAAKIKNELREEANAEFAKSKLLEQYGEKASEVVQSKAKEFGFSDEFLIDMARKNPNGFLKIVGNGSVKQELPKNNSVDFTSSSIRPGEADELAEIERKIAAVKSPKDIYSKENLELIARRLDLKKKLNK